MVLQSDIEKIRLTLEDIDRDSFDKATDAIVAARRIYIIGVRSSAAIATFLGFYFNLLFDNVAMITANTPSEVFESLLRVGEGDVVIGISFPRYSSRAVQMCIRDRFCPAAPGGCGGGNGLGPERGAHGGGERPGAVCQGRGHSAAHRQHLSLIHIYSPAVPGKRRARGCFVL